MMDCPFPAGVQSTEAAERALLALVSTGDRCAMEDLYIQYFPPLAIFFRNMTVRANRVAGLINDTMLEVWQAGDSIDPNVSVSLAVMRLAYAHVHRFFAATSPDTTVSPSHLQVFLGKLSIEERAVMHLVYAIGCSRRETAEVMEVTGDCVDVLLGNIRASAQVHLVVPSAQPTPR